MLRLVTATPIEEKILATANEKLDQEAKVIEGANPYPNPNPNPNPNPSPSTSPSPNPVPIPSQAAARWPSLRHARAGGPGPEGWNRRDGRGRAGCA